MTGILFLFTENFVAGERNAEKLVYPKITLVKFNMNGMPNKLYANVWFWESLKKKTLTINLDCGLI